MAKARTTEVKGQRVYVCGRCDQPIVSQGVVSGSWAVHVPFCPLPKK
jgi:hypothetical protein